MALALVVISLGLALLAFIIVYAIVRISRWRRAGKWRWPWLIGDVGWFASLGLIVLGVEIGGQIGYLHERIHVEVELDNFRSMTDQYETHMARVPATLGELALPATNARGAPGGPFLLDGWQHTLAQYRYEHRGPRSYGLRTSEHHAITQRRRGVLLRWAVFEDQVDRDLWNLRSAVAAYQVRMAKLPDSLAALTSSEAPLLTAVPSPPPGWSEYRYDRLVNGDWTISTARAGSRYVVGASPAGKWVGIAR